MGEVGRFGPPLERAVKSCPFIYNLVFLYTITPVEEVSMLGCYCVLASPATAQGPLTQLAAAKKLLKIADGARSPALPHRANVC